jgi:predicted PhzF superfamily epimerase YddE/YHI9
MIPRNYVLAANANPIRYHRCFHRPQIRRQWIGQGIDMGRASLLEAGAEKRGGKIIGMSIGGRCVPMTRGVLEV